MSNTTPADNTSINTNSREYLDQQASAVWEERFQELVHYQTGNGHCRVPTDSGILGKWVMHLREKHKLHLKEKGRFRGQLTAERIVRLETLGFEWTLRPPTTPWEERFGQLQAFYKQHGHSRVKRTDSAFGEWVQKQRKLFRAGKLSPERLQLLQSIGFEERIVPTNKSWDESFQLLLEFRRQHGHAHVPKPNKTTSGDDHSLAVWADRQRMYYHTCFLEKKVSPLNKKRVKQLETIGFNWGVHRTTQQQAWLRRFTELQQYRQQHGHSNVPTLFPENKSLGRWVSEQRANFNKKKRGLKSSMTGERQLALESIGFQWKKPKKSAGSSKAKATKPHPPIAAAAGATPVDTATNEEDGKIPAVNVGGSGSSTSGEDTSRVVQEAVAAVEAAAAGEMDLDTVGETASL